MSSLKEHPHRWRFHPDWQANVRQAWEEYGAEPNSVARVLDLPLHTAILLFQDMDLADNPLRRLTTREKQAYAGLCLMRYCSVLQVNHVYIEELIDHMLEMLRSENLSEWERHGAGLHLSGRGDATPDEVKDLFSEETLPIFEQFVNNAIEVGIYDMYGALSENTHSFFMQCVWALHNSSIALPTVPPSFGRSKRPGWGLPDLKIDLGGLKVLAR